jgi:hypothetical protein
MSFQDTYNQTRNAFVNRQEAIRKNALNAQQDQASITAGNALAGGDIPGAANALYKAGDIGTGLKVAQYDDATRAKHAEAAQRITQGIRAAVAAGHSPSDAYDMAQQIAPQLGINPQDLAKMRPAFDKDPQGFLDLVDAQSKKELQFFQTKQGIYAGDKTTGKVTQSMALPREPISLDPDKLNYIPEDGASPVASPAPPRAAAAPNADAVWASIHQQESGGQKEPGKAVGPNTPYGNALGSTQMLPATAEAMARKLGVPWNPALMRENTPQALAYQDKLGRAYFDEGVEKSGGDLAGGAAYYFGGPDMKLHGPKTAAYVQQVMSRAGQPLAGGSGADTVETAPQIPGYRLITPQAGGGKKAKWDIYIDPTGNTPYRYNSATAEATTLDGKPYTPSGLSKVAGGGTPRSAAALAVQRYIQENPGATAEDISQFNANLNKERSATTAFGTGKQGQTINSLNVSIDHLNTLSNLAGALGNGDIKLLNKWGQQWKAQTGNPAPTNFVAAKQIVGDEIVKGIVGAGGGVADREKAQAAISEASSPAQLAGVISTYKYLLAGQLNGLRLQYKNTTGRGDFEDKLLPATRSELEGVGARPTAPAAKAPTVIRYDAQGRRIK